MLQLKKDMELQFEKPKVKFTVKKILFTIVYALLLQAVIVVLIGSVLGTNSTFMKTPAGKLIINFITAATFILGVCVIYNPTKIYNELFKQNLNIKVIFSGLKWGLTAFLAGWLTNWLTYTIYSLIAVNPEPQSASLLLNSLSNKLFVPAIILVGFIAPLYEELVFRGLIQRTISQYTSPLLGVIGSGFLFSISHFDLYQIPGLFVMSLCFSITYKRSKTLYTPIIAHMVNNVIFIACFVLIS
ncbi:CPBP family intramembrane metalloprotease [Clostridium sp. 'deep sea']|uniref:CPBP family intramembrane glutamic endopeptidase n=1 Tax=Clostridium sp. 'deep sea' TaxID=2779445 RepID=UPI0018969700|nr:type II CAAX endopeptidase family protein [Clostridium sp. 'deep sea']QOR34326.1 CPBP family intramembrane metalloprotease [Clostridium sp. 'deep sea']